VCESCSVAAESIADIDHRVNLGTERIDQLLCLCHAWLNVQMPTKSVGTEGSPDSASEQKHIARASAAATSDDSVRPNRCHDRDRKRERTACTSVDSSIASHKRTIEEVRPVRNSIDEHSRVFQWHFTWERRGSDTRGGQCAHCGDIAHIPCDGLSRDKVERCIRSKVNPLHDLINCDEHLRTSNTDKCHVIACTDWRSCAR
jgi:hypothetical protein